jgi:hypothetical protein
MLQRLFFLINCDFSKKCLFGYIVRGGLRCFDLLRPKSCIRKLFFEKNVTWSPKMHFLFLKNVLFNRNGIKYNELKGPFRDRNAPFDRPFFLQTFGGCGRINKTVTGSESAGGLFPPGGRPTKGVQREYIPKVPGKSPGAPRHGPRGLAWLFGARQKLSAAGGLSGKRGVPRLSSRFG